MSERQISEDMFAEETQSGRRGRRGARSTQRLRAESKKKQKKQKKTNYIEVYLLENCVQT